jgi:hypothetical protein
VNTRPISFQLEIDGLHSLPATRIGAERV